MNETKLSVRQEFEVEVESPPNPDQIFITTNPDRDDLRLGQGILTTIRPKMTCLMLKQPQNDRVSQIQKMFELIVITTKLNTNRIHWLK